MRHAKHWGKTEYWVRVEGVFALDEEWSELSISLFLIFADWWADTDMPIIFDLSLLVLRAFWRIIILEFSLDLGFYYEKEQQLWSVLNTVICPCFWILYLWIPPILETQLKKIASVPNMFRHFSWAPGYNTCFHNAFFILPIRNNLDYLRHTELYAQAICCMQYCAIFRHLFSYLFEIEREENERQREKKVPLLHSPGAW